MIALRAPVGKIKPPDVRTFGNKGQDLLCNISHSCTRSELAPRPYVNAGRAQSSISHVYCIFLTHQRVIGTTRVYSRYRSTRNREGSSV